MWSMSGIFLWKLYQKQFKNKFLFFTAIVPCRKKPRISGLYIISVDPDADGHHDEAPDDGDDGAAAAVGYDDGDV